MWSERYERELSLTAAALQAEISEAIVAALTLKLLPEEKAAIEQTDTRDVEAYTLFLMARRYFEKARSTAKARAEGALERSTCGTEIDLDM